MTQTYKSIGCETCGSMDCKILNPYRDEYFWYHIECNQCHAFWDEAAMPNEDMEIEC
jgi:hypothetical protein